MARQECRAYTFGVEGLGGERAGRPHHAFLRAVEQWAEELGGFGVGLRGGHL